MCWGRPPVSAALGLTHLLFWPVGSWRGGGRRGPGGIRRPVSASLRVGGGPWGWEGSPVSAETLQGGPPEHRVLRAMSFWLVFFFFRKKEKSKIFIPFLTVFINFQGRHIQRQSHSEPGFCGSSSGLVTLSLCLGTPYCLFRSRERSGHPSSHSSPPTLCTSAEDTSRPVQGTWRSSPGTLQGHLSTDRGLQAPQAPNSTYTVTKDHHLSP